MNKEKIIKALSYVEDPDLKKDLVSLEMIQNLKIHEQEVSFDLVLTTPACPMKDSIANACKNAIYTMVDQEAIIKINITSRVQHSRDNQARPFVFKMITWKPILLEQKLLPRSVY